MSVRSSSAPFRHSPLRIIAGLLLPVVVVAGTALSVRLINGNRALAASDVRNQSTTRDVKSQSTAREIQSQSADGLWSFVAKTDSQAAAKIASAYRSYRKLRLNIDAFTVTLAKAPLEATTKSKTAPAIITLPQADGAFMRFAIVESPIMAPELAARYPEIKTYSAQGIDDPAATARFDWTPTGFHAIVLATSGTSLIEPAALGDVGNYRIYSPGDVIGSGECDVSADEQDAAVQRDALLKESVVTANVSSGMTLRTYRLAAAATGEYTQAYGGGTVSGGLSAITTTVNLVDAIYEREVAIRLTLIGNNDSIIYTNGATDPYTHENILSLISQNQTNLDGVIGTANYDVGHVFDGTILGGGFSWQGRGNFGVVCATGGKARGVDIFRSVFPTSIYAYYSAAHELGHQFNATHTFNTNSGACASERASATAYEPYTGSTIMGYRLNCSPSDLMSTDTYFHNASIEQIVNFSNSTSCALQTSTGNNPPFVQASAIYTIPMGTPFTLTATGSDPDGDSLTYCWEQFDLGTASPPDTDDGTRPIFRSFAPVTSPSRTFPRLSDILSGFSTIGETLPVTTRTMNFRVTARDNRSGGGGQSSAATQVDVRSDAGPFTVTQPASGANWPTGSIRTVTWNVANTNGAPVSCANVRILLSTDGGTTFPITVLSSTANDGSEDVTVPGTPTPSARIKVEAIGNIFFNISAGLTITGSATQTLTVASINPNSGVPITVSPTDNAGFGNGSTQFTRTFNRNAFVTLTAPNTTSGNNFLKWLRNGTDYSTNVSTPVSMDADYTMTAVFVPPPQIFVETGTNNAAAVDSVTFVRGPFRLFDPFNFSSDQRTRLILFTSDLGLTQPNPALLTVQASPASGPSVPLTVEAVGPVTGVAGLTGSYVVVRLPDGLPTGDLQLTLTLGGVTSNTTTLSIIQ